MSAAVTPFVRQYFHGTRADLKPGDLIVVGHASNFGAGTPLSRVHVAATLDAAMWGAELADGEGRQRIQSMMRAVGWNSRLHHAPG